MRNYKRLAIHSILCKLFSIIILIFTCSATHSKTLSDPSITLKIICEDNNFPVNSYATIDNEEVLIFKKDKTISFDLSLSRVHWIELLLTGRESEIVC